MKKRLQFLLTPFLVLIVQLALAQNPDKTITGTVTDQEGLPLPGVNVIVEGTQRGTQTDFDGNYSIVANSSDMLVFSYLGFETASRRVGDAMRIDATLSPDAAELEEVVVMGYVSKRRDDMTGSAVSVGSESIEQVPVASVDQALQGKVAGLNITAASGTPGAVQDIRIRGRSSITAGNDPLYVIDGVPISGGNQAAATSGSSLNPLASLNNNDIESITVLKDASATAAYGARGANGVIVITTKKGKSGRTSINFSSSYGFTNPAIDGPTVLTGAQREELYYEAYQWQEFGELGLTTAEAREYEGSSEETQTSQGAAYRRWNAEGRPEANWGDAVRNYDAPIQEYNISANGGNEQYNFYASLGYFAQEAVTIGSEFERISGSVNFSHQLGENFRFQTSNTASHTYQDGILEGSAYFSSPQAAKFFQSPLEQPYNEDGSFNLNTSLPNPFWIAQEDIDDQRLTRIISNNSLTWSTPIPNLDFTTRASIDYRIYNYKRYRNPVSGDGDATAGYGYQAHRNTANYVFQNSLNYFLQSNDHRLDFTVLQEYQENRNYFLEAEAENFVTTGLTNLASAGTPTLASSEFTDWAVASYLGTASYSFNNIYVLNGTYRREGNSRFSPENRWGNFWSAGAALNFHRMGFLEGNNNVNMLKLRGSYGVTGNASIDLNAYQVLYSYDADYGGTGAAYPSTFGNENLTWETSDQYDLGIDFAFLENRINGTMSYYFRESKDLLLEVPLSRTTGFANQEQNVGTMTNQGFEAELEWNIVRSDDFNLTIGGNFATNENEVTSMPQNAAGNDITITEQRQRVEAGHPAYGWYLPTWAGVDPDTGFDTWYTDGVGSEITTSFGESNRVFQGGSALPTVNVGLNFHVDFKGFFVDANAFYQGGHKVYESWHLYTSGANLYPVGVYQGIDRLMTRWQQPGDVTRIERMQHGYEPWEYSSKYLFDGDFARLRNVTVGYNLNSSIAEAAGITSGRIFVRGTNLGTWVKDDNLIWDPEVNASGSTDMFTPATRSIIFGINVNL
ncbi:SusC/RagA family TonB-linked outer membrane protein [Salinimicrobium marinum]|uniref:SusC/RagA family TonB-linked outer membrane protein n=1 Tax=Salinimicrobium marinum TaxID=680283 RepID=A0A918SLI0_9FLAO|nr:TonB-dependent receptor [Salinimicrobium marinum]GHA51153.1 SusC/RagA family TonB-linked outer membrane protein [Salinimicrobium marinum]